MACCSLLGCCRALAWLVIEKRPSLKVLHAVGESGVMTKEIATAIGTALNVPLTSKTTQEGREHFGWLASFAAMDCNASSEKTRKALGWSPKQIGLLET